MSSRNKQEAVTPETAITPEQASEVNLFNVQDEFEHFLDAPYSMTMESLVKKLVREAYPGHPEAPGYFGGALARGRKTQDEVSRFPVFPLSKMQDLDEFLVDLVFDWSYPEPKYSFGPQDEIHDILVRSDSEHAHNALVGHITLPFPRDRQTVWDGPDEMQYKSRLIGDLFDAATYHGTPDLNPLAARSLTEIYTAIKPGGITFEWAEEQEAELSEEELRYRNTGPTTRNLRELQENMLAKFMKYPHPVFDGIVRETLAGEVVDDKRLFTVVEALVTGILRKREDGYYGEIADQIIAPYDQEVADLVKQYISQSWDRGEEGEKNRTQAKRELSRRLIAIELEKNADRDNVNSYNSSPLLSLAVSKHPLRSVLLKMGDDKKSEWVKNPNYYEDLSYLLDLVRGPNIDGIRSLASWRIAKSFEGDYSYDDRPRRAKVAYMAIADAVLSPDSTNYEDLRANGLTGVMGAMGDILRQTPTAMDHMTDEDLSKLMTYREAYQEYVFGVYPEGTKHRPPQGADAEWSKFHEVTSLSRDFAEMSRQFGERLERREIQTNPKKYAQYMFASVARYVNRFADHVKREGQHASRDHRRFNDTMQEQLIAANNIHERAQNNEEVDEKLIRFVAETARIERSYYQTELRYDNEFYHGYTRLTLDLSSNLPLQLQARALEMIEAGEIFDYMGDDVRSKLRHKLSRAKLTDN